MSRAFFNAASTNFSPRLALPLSLHLGSVEMRKKFAYPLVVSLATVTAMGGLAACANDNGSSGNRSTSGTTTTNPSTGTATSGNSANPAGNPGSANTSGGQSGSGSGSGGTGGSGAR
jgi:hypothetical protein